MSMLGRAFVGMLRRRFRVARPGSLRLAFKWDDSGLRLIRQTPRHKAAPPTALLDTQPPPNTVVLEVRSRSGPVKYRRLLAEPFPQTVEVADDDGRFHRVDAPWEAGAFTVVVPLPTAPAVVVLSVGAEVELAQPALAAPPGARPRQRELARFNLESQR